MATSIGKLNVTNIKSPLGGGKTPIHKLNFTSGLKVGSNKFAGTPAQLGDTAKFNISRIDDIISLEDRAKLSEQKISSLTRILSLQKKNKNKERDQLTEINDSLKDIGNALALDFANRITEEKQELNLGKDQIRKDKLSFKEKLLESGKRMGETIKKTTATIAAPALGIFGRIFEFLKTVFTGALIGKSLDWLNDEKNAEKLTRFFNRIKENLPTFGRIGAAAGILLFLGKISPILNIISTAVSGLVAGLTIFANPLTWKILAAVAVGVLIWKAGKWIENKMGGGEVYTQSRDLGEEIAKSHGLEVSTAFHRDAAEAIVLDDSGSPLLRPRMVRDGMGNIVQSGWAQVDLNNEGDRAWLKENISEEKFNKLMEANLQWEKRLKDLRELQLLMEAEKKKKEEEIKKRRENEWNALSVYEKRHPMNSRGSFWTGAYNKETIRQVNEALLTIEKKYADIIIERGLLTRKKGGSFSSGLTYLVGENGPELARFNGHGTIERNGRTAQLLADDIGSGVNIIPFDLPTIKASAPKLSSNTKATVANDIVTYSSVNITNPYMVEVPEIFGITV